jgi:hypothetical protein
MHRTPQPPLVRAFCDWIRHALLRKTATPYETYWSRRAFAAEARVLLLEAELRRLYSLRRR